jgi:hypothetical protein
MVCGPADSPAPETRERADYFNIARSLSSDPFAKRAKGQGMRRMHEALPIGVILDRQN